MLISEVEKALHVKFSMAEMQGIKTLRAIIDKIRDYGTT
jgi:acyl carrier protein